MAPTLVVTEATIVTRRFKSSESEAEFFLPYVEPATHVNRKWTFCILGKWEKESLPLDVCRSKTSLLNFPIPMS